MALVFQCTCGRPLRAPDDAAGKRTKCPHCGKVVPIPGNPASGESKLGTTDSQIPATREHDPLSLDLDWEALGGSKLPRSGIINVEPTASSFSMPAMAPAEEAETEGRYKVLTLKDQGFTGKFSASKLEEQLNHAARKGWSVKTAVSLTIPGGHGASHDELIVILERNAASTE